MRLPAGRRKPHPTMNTPRVAVVIALLCSALEVSAVSVSLAATVNQTNTPPVPPTAPVPSNFNRPPTTPVVPPVVNVQPPTTANASSAVKQVPAVRTYPPLHTDDPGAKPPVSGPTPPKPPNPPTPSGTVPPPPPGSTPTANNVTVQYGDPLPGLTNAQRNLFLDGKDGFMKVQTVEGGLGPIFNRDSCVACHSAGGVGGGSVVNTTRFWSKELGQFDPLAPGAGLLLHDRAIAPEAQAFLPRSASIITQRNSTPLFGLGLIEAISEFTIVSNARKYPNDQIHGRIGYVRDIVTGGIRSGRFGWKAQHGSLTAFSADAYRNEMGITNKHFPAENAPNGNLELLAKYDKVLDPEDQATPGHLAEFESVANFMRFLAPPTPGPAPLGGLALFTSVGCAQCHTPMLSGGSSPVAALSSKPVWLYSDLLLHDMGSLGDGISQGAANGNEFRTPPLWGASQSAPYLHDGRAPTIDAAIRAHEGEGRIVRDRYLKLNAAQQKLLSDFVLSL